MANKFQRSVKERLDAEAARKVEAPPAPENFPQELPVNNNEPLPAAKAAGEQAQRNAPRGGSSVTPVKAQSPVPDVSAYLRREPQRMAKNKTFYLDMPVINAIKQAAQAQRVTDSKLVNDILRSVLGLSD